MSNLAAIVLCAGKGTRMKSAKVKVIHPLLGKPLCAYPIARALEVGASPIVAVVGHQSEQVAAEISAAFPSEKLLLAKQVEQLGTADAVKAAQQALSGFAGAILILYGDVPLLRAETLQSLVAAYQQRKGSLALVSTRLADPTGYGRIIREGGKVHRIVEQKDCTPSQLAVAEVNAGVYLADAAFLWKALSQVKSANAQRELYLTDMVELAAEQGEVSVVEAEATDTTGVNDRAELAFCAEVLRRRINTRHMKAGVAIEDPANTYIEEGVEIGADSELAPLVCVRAGSRIGRGVRVGQGSVIIASVIADGTEIKPYSVLEEAELGPACVIGPFARLRPGSRLAEQVHIGNFVETKKTTLGKASKANHLAYLGDATIGAGVNIGAGTITCNYDGVAKHSTVVGDNAFIGSDSQLVAPVTIGEGAFVAAGSTVTEDVPSMALALSRVPQVNKEGWVAKRKRKIAGEKVG